jgi:agmatinase
VTDPQCPRELFEYPQRPGRSSLPQEGTFLGADWDRTVARAKEFGLEASPSIQDRTISTFSRGSLAPAGGMKTFLKAPYLEDVRIVSEYDVAILGVPLDTERSDRPGTCFGPQAIRRISALSTPYNFPLDVDIREHISLCDLGDVFVIPSDLEKSFDQISRAVSHVFRSGTFPVLLGGDHAMRYPTVRGLAPHVKGKVGLIHFDCYVDAQETDLTDQRDKGPWFHPTPIAHALSKNLELAGIAKQVPRAGIKVCREQETIVLTATDICDMGLDQAIDSALSMACEGNDAVYLSVDIDSIDTGFASRRGRLKSGLLAPHEALYMVQRIARGTTLCGLEVIGVSPPHDVSDMTSLMATQVIMEVLAVLVDEGKLPRHRPNWLNAAVANESWSL